MSFGLALALTPGEGRGGAIALGPELLSNGDFGSDTIWTKGTGWSIVGGVGARAFDVASGSIGQSIVLTAGRNYRVSWTLLNYASGIFAPRFTGGTTRTGTVRSANGVYSENLLANTGNVMFEIIAGGGAQGDIDNVSVREVL